MATLDKQSIYGETIIIKNSYMTIQ